MKLTDLIPRPGSARAAAASATDAGNDADRRSPPKLVLHVGSHKTGTTGIQFALSENRDHLASVGVWYPRTADHFEVDPRLNSARAHFAFAQAVNDFAPEDRAALARFLDALRTPPRGIERIVLSAESMYRLTPDARTGRAKETPEQKRLRYVERLAGLLAGFDTEVLLYLRRVDRFAASLYAESIARSNNTQSFHEFITSREYRFDYRRQIDLLAAYFPVTVRGFETAARAGLIESFCADAGIPGRLPSTGDRPRPSVSNAAVLWIRRAKLDREMTKKLRNRRWHFALLPENAKLFGTGDQTGFWADAAERNAFVERYQAGVDEVDFPPIGDEIEPQVQWTDAQHAKAERRFKTWVSTHQLYLLKRERARIPPFALDA